MRWVILNNKTRIEVDWCGKSAGPLYINIVEKMEYSRIKEIFSQPITSVVFEYGEFKDVYNGDYVVSRIKENGWSRGSVLVTLRPRNTMTN